MPYAFDRPDVNGNNIRYVISHLYVRDDNMIFVTNGSSSMTI